MNAPARLRRPVWDAATTKLVCVGARDETRDVKTFTLAPEDGSRVRFDPGQHLTLDWRLEDGSETRPTFTIASSPARGDAVELTVKAQAEGRATRDLHARLRPGARLRAWGPAGRFGLSGRASDRLLLIGAGSGITPMMSMLRCARDRRWTADLVLIQAARTPADALFLRELAQADAALAKLSVIVVPSRVPPGESWFGPRGRLDRRLLRALVPDARTRDVFCCGPESFMETVRLALRAEGLDPARFHTERFHPVAAPLPPPPAACAEAGWTLTLARSGRKITAAPDRTLLDTLRGAGVAVASGCRSGLCGTCRTRRLAGEAATAHQGGLTERQEAAGDLLVCRAWPRGDLSLDL